MILENINNTIVPEMDWGNQRMVSYTQFSAWSECPHKWRLMYIDKHKSPPNIHLVFGTAMHESIQEYLDLMYNKSLMAADKFDIYEDFQSRFIKLYKGYKDNLDENFSTPEEITEFINDGLDILDFFIQRRQLYFSKQGVKLVGIEMPILTPPHQEHSNVMLYGKLDIVIYDEETKKLKIIDIKTSTRGWTKWDKENKTKISQMIIYKKYYSDQYNVPIDDIECEYFILKRKIPEDPKYPVMSSRIQTFKPASGKVTINRVTKQLLEFIDDCFENDMYKMKEYKKYPSEKNCKYCPFNDQPHLCNKKS